MKEEQEKEIPKEVWVQLERREDGKLQPYNVETDVSKYDGTTFHKDKFIQKYILVREKL